MILFLHIVWKEPILCGYLNFKYFFFLALGLSWEFALFLFCFIFTINYAQCSTEFYSPRMAHRLRGKSSALRDSATSSGSILLMVLSARRLPELVGPEGPKARSPRGVLRIVVRHVLLAGCALRSIFRIGFGFSSLVDVRAARTCWKSLGSDLVNG